MMKRGNDHPFYYNTYSWKDPYSTCRISKPRIFADTRKNTASEQTSWRYLVLSIRNHHGFPRLPPFGLSLQFTEDLMPSIYQGGIVESLWRSRVNWGLRIHPGTPCTPFWSILYPLCHLLLPSILRWRIVRTCFAHSCLHLPQV